MLLVRTFIEVVDRFLAVLLDLDDGGALLLYLQITLSARDRPFESHFLVFFGAHTDHENQGHGKGQGER